MLMAAADVRGVLERWILANGMPLVCDLQKSHGSYLHDSSSGIDYLDFFGFVAARPLSFNHSGLRTPEFLERLTAIAIHKPTNCDIYTREYADFVDRFCSVALGGAFAHVFFIEGGGPAVDNAVKAAIDWKHHKNIAAGRGEMGSQILHFRQAFHGRTGYALSLTDSHDSRKTRFFPRFPWPRVLNPKMSFPFDADAEARVQALEAQAVAEIDAVFDKHTSDVAAIIIEPIQGEGGDNYFRTEFLRELRRIADEREALLIFDEVQTGFGASGAWWDWQHHGVQPDLMVFGKKTQVCGFAATSRIDEVDGVFKVGSRISSTFEGNLTDMVRCWRIIEIVENDGLLENARAMGAYLNKALCAVAENFPEMTAVRGRGLWAAFDLPTADMRNKLWEACFAEQLLLSRGGERAIRLRPALDVRADAIGRAAAQLEAALRRAFR